MVAAYRRTHSPSRLAWSEGWRPPGAESAFITWTRVNSRSAVWQHDDSTINIVLAIIIIIINTRRRRRTRRCRSLFASNTFCWQSDELEPRIGQSSIWTRQYSRRLHTDIYFSTVKHAQSRFISSYFALYLRAMYTSPWARGSHRDTPNQLTKPTFCGRFNHVIWFSDG